MQSRWSALPSTRFLSSRILKRVEVNALHLSVRAGASEGGARLLENRSMFVVRVSGGIRIRNRLKAEQRTKAPASFPPAQNAFLRFGAESLQLGQPRPAERLAARFTPPVSDRAPRARGCAGTAHRHLSPSAAASRPPAPASRSSSARSAEMARRAAGRSARRCRAP